MNRAAFLSALQGKRVGHILADLRAELKVNSVLETIDADQLRACQERYKTPDLLAGSGKYLDVRPWMKRKLTYFYLLGLDRTKPLNILDLGTGTGYFPYVCTLNGHTVVTIDLDSDPIYNDICQMLHIDRRTWRISKYEKLPDLGLRFDLVTAFMISFNNGESPEKWGVGEWRFLLEDLAQNHLRKNGRTFFTFNKNSNGTYHDDELRSFFLKSSASIFRNQVDMRSI